MPDVRALRAEILDESGAALGVRELAPGAGFDQAMERARAELEPASRERARSARLSWVGEDGQAAFWCEGWWTRPSDFVAPEANPSELAAAIRRVPAMARLSSPPAFMQLGPCAYSIMPDFGDASLWDANGANACLEPGDAATGREGLAVRWEAMLSRWQRLFEAHVDEHEPGRARAGAPEFEWPEFNGRAACLALSSRSVLRFPARVRAPCESPGSRAVDWIPGWGEGSASAAEACSRLEELDEEAFAEAVSRGARQSPGAPMPWAAYCAHMGLPRALAAAAATDPESATRPCLWGSNAWTAALARQDPACLEALERSAPVAPEGFGFLWPRRLAWRGPDSGREEDALAALRALHRIAPMGAIPSLPPESPGAPARAVEGAMRALWEARQIAPPPAPGSQGSTRAGGRVRGAL